MGWLRHDNRETPQNHLPTAVYSTSAVEPLKADIKYTEKVVVEIAFNATHGAEPETKTQDGETFGIAAKATGNVNVPIALAKSAPMAVVVGAGVPVNLK